MCLRLFGEIKRKRKEKLKLYITKNKEKMVQVTLKSLTKPFDFNIKWKQLFHMFYIEPILYVLVFSHSLSGTIMKNEIIYQTCIVVYQYNESDCIKLGTRNITGYLQEIETEVQPYAADLSMMRTLLESIVPLFCGVFVGSWSDHYGRKPLLLVSMIGFSFTYVIAAIVCAISRYYPVNPWYYILPVLPHSILGGNCVFSVAAFCYISDITDTKTRPYRMISFEVFLALGLTSGSFLSSFVYAATNATTTFAISGILMVLVTSYIAIAVPESLSMKPACEIEADKFRVDEKGYEDFQEIKLDKMECNGIDGDCDTKKSIKDNDKKKAASLFSYVHVKDMWITSFKKRPCYDRTIIILITGTIFLSYFVWDGIVGVFYLFVREKFQWSIRDFTFYETISHIVLLIGSVIGFLILRKFFHLSVVTLALLAFASEVLRSFVQGIASEPWHLYLAIALGFFKGMGGPMCRTIISNIIPATDLGKIFSIKNILQSLAPFVAAPLYAEIYKASLITFPGLFNIVSATLYLIAFIFLIFVYRFKVICKEHYEKVLK
ncbi:proton-coupled folate transporter [Glossina fuscipes]|uniref:Proton-coupled folate transporter n=1 Tax=Glossina fuscipes TaxID=7396 RepID=A0A9C6DQJ2_9MUSC|nr:proton-coupled folate transporter [Glossina fuscipes]